MKDIETFYNQYADKEWSRLDTPLSILEFSTGKHLIDKYLKGSGSICDIGGGPGRYGQYLSGKGYEVTLVDLSPKLIEIAKKKDIGAKDYICASATDLNMFENQTFDSALLMGPMYHLIDGSERNKALSELHRVLKPYSRAVITYFGSLGMLRLGISDLESKFEDPNEIERFLDQTTFTSEEMLGFTQCHFSTPERIITELENAELKVLSYASAQGFAGGIRADLENLYQRSPAAFNNVVEKVVKYCEDPRFRDLGQHLHFVVERR